MCSIGIVLFGCKPRPSAAPSGESPEIVGVRLALAIDPKTLQLQGSGDVFEARVLNRVRKLRVAILLKGLRGGETLIVTLVNPQGEESAPITKQYGADEKGDFYATAVFEATQWQTGLHRVQVNLHNERFTTYEFIVSP